MSWMRQSTFSYRRSSHNGIPVQKGNGQHLLRWLYLNDARIPHNDAIVGLLKDANNLKAMETWPHSINMAYSRVQHGYSRVSL